MGNEGRFVLRVTERVSIPSHRHSGLSMMEFRSCCVYMCIHFILSRAIRLLGHHASICVIGGTRIEDYTPRRVVMHTYAKILCYSKSEIRSLPELGTYSKNNCKQRQTGASRGILRTRRPEHTSFIVRSRFEAVPGLHANLLLS